MTSETLIDDSGPQMPHPDNGQPGNGVSERKRAANRANSQKSTGPRSEMGKRIASHNSLKSGYYSAERRLQLMQQLDEDPAERERLRQDLYLSYPPGAPVESMLLDDLADLWWKRAQLDRLDASVKLREIDRADVEEYRREERRESNALDATNSEVEKGGLVRLKDSAGKFEVILGILEDLLLRAETRQLSLHQQGFWMALYGTSDRNWYAEHKFAPLEAGETGEAVDYEALTDFLKDELDSYTRARARYLAEHQEQTEAEREARLVSCSGDGLILFKEMEVTDRQIDRKLRLLLKARADRAREEKEGSKQKAEGSKQKAEGGPQSPDGSGQAAEGSPQSPDGNGHQATARLGKTFDLQPSTFDFLKNEATDLIDNKGLAPGEVRNEPTVESGRQSAEGAGQSAGVGQEAAERPENLAQAPTGVGREAAERRNNLAQGASPGVDGHPASSLFHRFAEGSRQSTELVASATNLKNEATDLIDNKGSASAEVRNEPTVQSGKQWAGGSRQTPQNRRRLAPRLGRFTSPGCGRQRHFSPRRRAAKAAEPRRTPVISSQFSVPSEGGLFLTDD